MQLVVSAATLSLLGRTSLLCTSAAVLVQRSMQYEPSSLTRMHLLLVGNDFSVVWWRYAVH